MEPRLIKEIVRELIATKYAGNQSAFADDIGVTRGPVSRWLSGADDPDYDSVKAIWLKYPTFKVELQAAWDLLPPKSRKKKPRATPVPELAEQIALYAKDLTSQEITEFRAILKDLAARRPDWRDLRVCLGQAIETAVALKTRGRRATGE